MGVDVNKAKVALFAVAAVATVTGMGCSQSSEDWRVGGLYSIESGDSGYGVVKILALDPGVVNVRIYKQRFTTRPDSIDASSLTLGKIDDPDGFGIGHLPISEATFSSWAPVFLSQQTVAEEELDGYHMWKESGSGPLE